MANLLRWVGSTCVRYAKTVLALWIAVLAIAGICTLVFAQGTTSNYSIPGASFEQVKAQVQRDFPEAGQSTGHLVLQTQDGSPFTEAQLFRFHELAADALGVAGITSVSDPFEQQKVADQAVSDLASGKEKLAAAQQEVDSAKAQLEAAKKQLLAGGSSENLQDLAPQLAEQSAQLEAAQNTIKEKTSTLEDAQLQLDLAAGARVVNTEKNMALSTISFEGDVQSLPPAEREKIFAVFDQLKASGFNVYYSNEMVQDVSQVFGASEAIGLAVAAIVLLVTLASVIAAGLPVAIALMGCAIGVALVFASTGFIPMTATDPVLALMIGLGVGIDYALLIVHRHREFLVAGLSVHDAAANANATAGHSVLFAGMTNIIALAALTLTGIPFLSIMGLAGAFTVAVVVLVSLTLTPAVLALLGHRVLSKKQKAALAGSLANPDIAITPEQKLERGNRGWGAFVTRHPVLMVFASLAVLALAMIPTTTLRLGLPDGSYQLPDSTAYQAYQLTKDNFGPGYNGQIITAVTTPVGTTVEQAQHIGLEVAQQLKTEGIASATIVNIKEDGSSLLIALTPTTGPSEETTVNTVHHVREILPTVEELTRTQIGITGQTVANIDISERISQAIPLYLGVVLILCLILMTLVFHSILIPLMATVGFLMSTLAAFGAVVAVYQWGWLAPVFGVTEPGPILAFLPILLIGILFGLSVDYQIFIVSGMKDAYREGFSAHQAVRVGYRQGAAVVTACGIIMISVFAGFIFSHLTVVRPIGFALALGVAMDAFLVRTTFIPAAMHLLGEKAWWLPRFLKNLIGDARSSAGEVIVRTDQNDPRHKA